MSDEKKTTSAEQLPAAPLSQNVKKLRRLRWRERMYVEALVGTGDPKQAQIAARYKGRTDKVTQLLTRREPVKRAIEAAFEKKFPDAENVLAKKLQEVINMPIKSHNNDVGISVADLMKVADMVAKLKGLYAPTETHSKKLIAKVTTPLGTLGNSGEKD
jgi:hypothetical protein